MNRRTKPWLASVRAALARIPSAHWTRLRWQYHRARRPAWLRLVQGLQPVSETWGYDRGTPIERFYIEQFLGAHCSDIHGHVLEVKDSRYTDRFGRGVVERDIIDVDPHNRHATIVRDLADASAIASNQFDCFLLIQTLQYIYDLPAAIRHAHRVLVPGGVLLVSVPALSRLERSNIEREYWRFTHASCTRLFEAVFGQGRVTVRAHGNILAAMASMTGLAREELTQYKLAREDVRFPVILTVRAVK